MMMISIKEEEDDIGLDIDGGDWSASDWMNEEKQEEGASISLLIPHTTNIDATIPHTDLNI